MTQYCTITVLPFQGHHSAKLFDEWQNNTRHKLRETRTETQPWIVKEIRKHEL